MSDHKVLWHHDMDTIVGEIICTADPEAGALCRLDCEHPGCEEGWVGPATKDVGGWFHDYDLDDPDSTSVVFIRHPLKFQSCNVREWIHADSSVAGCYGGPETEVRSGPINVTWNGDYFEWTYVSDEQEG